MVYRIATRLASIVILLSLILTHHPMPSVQAQSTATPDDEIIYIDASGRIKVIDPNVADGTQAIQWESPDTGWFDFATGDFNNDGDAEIVAIGNGKLTIFDPVVQSADVGRDGEYNLVPWARLFEMAVSSPSIVAAGNMDQNVAGDEIIFGYSVNEPNNVTYRMTVIKRTDNQGRQWTNHVSAGYGAPWKFVAVGNINNTGSADIVRIRDIDHRIEAVEIDNNFGRIFERAGDSLFTYTTAAIGQLYPGGTGEVGMARTFNGTDQAPSVLIYSFFNNQWGVQDDDDNDDTLAYFPHPTAMFYANVNGNDDDELFWIRPTQGSNVRMLMINRGNDQLPDFQARLDDDNGYTRGVGGDTDADGRDEVIVMRNNQMLQFNAPEAGTTVDNPTSNTRTWQITSNQRSLHAANLDGNGYVAGNRFNVDTSAINVSLAAGTLSPAIQTIQLSTTGKDAEIPFSVEKEQGANWFTVSTSRNVTPASIFVSGFNATQLKPGVYSDRLIVRSSAAVLNQPFYIPVTLTVTEVQFSVSRSEVGFAFPTDFTGQQRTSIGVSSPFPGLTFSVAMMPAPAFESAVRALGETPRFGHLTEEGDIVLTNVFGKEHRIELTEEPRISAAAVSWPSVPWATVESVGNLMPDTITITASPQEMTQLLERAILVVVADERAGVYPNNIAIVEVTALKEVEDTLRLPLIFR